MNEDLKQAVRTTTTALQFIDVNDDDLATLLPAIERNAALISRLSPRISFEDEPSLYTRVIESAKG